MNCCHDASQSDQDQEGRKLSWKTITVVVIILTLLVVSSLSLVFH